MNRRQFTKFSRRLAQVLGEDTITRLGRTTGFTHRLREVTPHRMAMLEPVVLRTTLVTSCGVFTLAEPLRYKPFHMAKDAFPTFVAAFEHLAAPRAPRAGPRTGACAARLRLGCKTGRVTSRGCPAGPARTVHEAPSAVELHATMTFHDQAGRATGAPMTEPFCTVPGGRPVRRACAPLTGGSFIGGEKINPPELVGGHALAVDARRTLRARRGRSGDLLGAGRAVGRQLWNQEGAPGARHQSEACTSTVPIWSTFVTVLLI